MNLIAYFQFNLVILAIFGFFVTSCFSQNTRAIPESAIIRYDENGTPCYIKGANLSFHLDNDPQFRVLKEKGLYGDAVYQLLESWRQILKIDDPRREFNITSEKIDDLGLKHIEFRQVLNGIAIWGRSMSVHLNQNNDVYLLQGHYEPTLKNAYTTPKLSAQEAAERAISEAPGGEEGWHAEERKLFIFMVGAQAPRLAYRITLVRGLMRREYYFVDAGNGKILHKLSGTTRGHSLSLPR